MSNIYKTVVTSEGARLIAQSIQGGERLKITAAAVGDGGGAQYVPQVSQRALKGERWRGRIAGSYMNGGAANVVDVEISVPEPAAGFTAREAGIFSDDGTLIAVGSLPDTLVAPMGGGFFGRLTVVMHIAVEDAAALDVLVMPQKDAVCGFDMEIAPSAWEERTAGDGGYAYEYVYESPLITGELWPDVTVKEESLDAAADCGLCPVCETVNGGLKLLSKARPASALKARCRLMGKGLSGADGAGA